MSDDDLDRDPVEDEIFTVEPLEWKVDASKHGRLVTLSAGSNTLLMGTDKGWVIKVTVWDDRKEYIPLPRRGENVHKVFIDPTAAHGLVSTLEGNTYYVQVGQNKIVPIRGLRGEVAESVAWSKLTSILASTKTSKHRAALSTGSILVGTRDGSIYEVVVEEAKERVVKKVWYEVEKSRGSLPISGLQMDIFPGDQNKFFVMATSPTRQYQFVGGPTFEALFQPYMSSKTFNSLPGDLDYTELHFLYNKFPQGNAQRFAWLTQAGIFTSELVYGAQKPGEAVVNPNSDMLVPYPQVEGGRSARSWPQSIATTKFHYMLLFREQFICVNRLNRAVVYDISLREDTKKFGNFRALATDAMMGTYWMFSDRSVFEIIVEKEDRDVWKLYLEENKFDDALRHCRADNKVDRRRAAQVLSAKADYLFSKRYFKQAAQIYAETDRGFEEIALKFADAKASDALKTYLLQKLIALPSGARTQQTMLSTWLTEIFLDQLHDLDLAQPPDATDAKGRKRLLQEREDEKSRVSKEFVQFLDEYGDCLDQTTTFTLISSHGRLEELEHYAELIDDREWLIRHAISTQRPKRAWRILVKYFNQYCTSQRRRKKQPFEADLFYTYAPALLTQSEALAAIIVENLIKMDAKMVNPARLIPAFMRYDARLDQRRAAAKSGDAVESQAIRYYSAVIEKYKITDPTVHNYLITLFVKEEGEDELIKFVQKSGGNPRYDFKHALRLCHQNGRSRSVVELYTVCGFYEEAIKVALTLNVQLAQIVAIKAKSKLSEEMNKRLWLMVAKHVIKTEEKVKLATQKISDILKHCTFLRIEDVLPFFPDFERIGSFKSEIENSLKIYNQTIASLKQQMDSHTQTAEKIRGDIDRLQNESAAVSKVQRCDLSKEPLSSGPFLFFPCGHAFLVEPLVDYVSDYACRFPRTLREPSYDKTISGDAKIKQAMCRYVEEIEEKGAANGKPDLTRNEWSKIAGSECVLCGSIMIASCQQQFISTDEKDQEELKSWEV